MAERRLGFHMTSEPLRQPVACTGCELLLLSAPRVLGTVLLLTQMHKELMLTGQNFSGRRKECSQPQGISLSL